MNYATLWALPMLLLPLTSTAQYGVLDPSFNAVGHNETGHGLSYTRTDHIIYQANGGILVANVSAFLMETKRLSPDGIWDTEWSTSMDLPVNSVSGAIVERPDGKVVLATMGPTGANEIRLLRYTVDSELDSLFGTDGEVVHPLPDIDLVHISTLTLLPDGRMLLAGSVEGVTDQLMVARFQEDGSLDSTFSGTGMLLLDVADGAAAQDMELRPDGRIVLGGYAMEAGTKQLLLVQLMADGALDASFGTAGIVTVDLGFSIQSILAITLTPSGSLIAAGGAGASVSDSNALLASFSSTGELDTGFSTNGWLTVETGEGANSFTDVLLDQDGMILACGQVKLASSFYYQLILTRRALNGAVDPTFGTNGTTIPDLQYGGGGMCLALQNDGKILVGGVYDTGNNLDAMVARFTPGMSVGINEPEAAEPLSISPNPARDHIRITLPDPGHAYALRIHDASGRIVQQEQLGATDRPLVDVRGLAEGTYQLVLTDGEQLYRASCIVAR